MQEHKTVIKWTPEQYQALQDAAGKVGLTSLPAFIKTEILRMIEREAA
jgi:hypothetical protein